MSEKQEKSLFERVDSILQRYYDLGAQQKESDTTKDISQLIIDRIEYIGNCVKATVCNSNEAVVNTVNHLKKWMINGSVVRIIGAGRARLAGAMPANRLHHGGARVYFQNDIIPLPHSVKGGGLIALSASGKTKDVLDIMQKVYKMGDDITIIGIASSEADEFKKYCHEFIGIVDESSSNPLSALADTGEYVISDLLDALVVAAGKLAGFDDIHWRLGHEDLGSTGPYDIFDR